MIAIPDAMPSNDLVLTWAELDQRMTNLERGVSAFRESLGLPPISRAMDPLETWGSEVAPVKPLTPAVVDAAFVSAVFDVADPVTAIERLPEANAEALPGEANPFEPTTPSPVVASALTVLSDAEHRGAGVALLKKAGQRDATGTELMAAGGHFFQAYLSHEDARLQGSDIAHCGICLWQAVLEFFRCAARANLPKTQCGAPEELLLTMALKPLEFPGGILGKGVRSALQPRQIFQLIRCVELARLCFRRAADFGESALGSYWEATVIRGIGSFAECRQMAREAQTDHAGIAVAAVVKGIEDYLADFQMIEMVSSGGVSDAWGQPLVLEAITPLCESLEADPFLARTKAGQKKGLLGDAEGIVLASRVTAPKATDRSDTPVFLAPRSARAA